MSAFIDVLNRHYAPFITDYQHQLTPHMTRAISRLCRCQTDRMGRSHWQCSECEYHDAQSLSCGHRACPQCQHRTTVDWIARKQDSQLPVAHYMVTFTLPAQLRFLASKQPKALYTVMFKVAASVLKDFAKRKHGGQSGFTLVLHTHNRKRDLHPHIHAIVPAGYYNKARRQWHQGNKGYLYNAFALAKVWRARMLEAINQHPLLSLPRSLPDKWVVDCRHIGRGPSVLKYLSRYLYRGVLPDKDILSTDNGQVTFRYKDSHTRQWHTRTLPVLKFLWLIMQHVLPKGFQRVREYGLMHGSAKAIRQQVLLLLIRQGMKVLAVTPAPVKAQRQCPKCKHTMTCTSISRPT